MQQVSLSIAPWERPTPIVKHAVHGTGNLPRDMSWLERYWVRERISSEQYVSGVTLAQALRAARCNPQSNSLVAKAENMKESIPSKFWPCVEQVLVFEKSIHAMESCTGGRNFTLNVKKLRNGLDAVTVHMQAKK